MGQIVNLEFTRGSIRECHTVDILLDDVCEEPPENFFADLAYVSGIPTINIITPTTEVIIDDTAEEECGKWKHSCQFICIAMVVLSFTTVLLYRSYRCWL